MKSQKSASVKPNTNRLFQLVDSKLGVLLQDTFPSFELARHCFESAYMGKFEILEHPLNGEVKSHGVIFRNEETYVPNVKYANKVEEYFQEKLM
jgi:hypothetical protein